MGINRLDSSMSSERLFSNRLDSSRETDEVFASEPSELGQETQELQRHKATTKANRVATETILVTEEKQKASSGPSVVATTAKEHNPLARHVRKGNFEFIGPCQEHLGETRKGHKILNALGKTFLPKSVVIRRHSKENQILRHRTILLPKEKLCLESKAMQEFVAFTGNKILLIPEAHDTEQALHSRREIRKMDVISFSEGVTGDPRLGGVEGIETIAEIEAPVFLKQLVEHGDKEEDLAGIVQNPKEFYEACAEIGLKKSRATVMLKDLANKTTLEGKNEVVTKYQMHQRDIAMAHKTALRVQELARSDVFHIGIGFFGACHLVEGCDEPEVDARTTEERIPDLLIRNHNAYNIGRHLLMNKDSRCESEVRVFIYPKVLQEDIEDSEVLDLIRLAKAQQKKPAVL